MSLHQLANHLQSKGRKGDEVLVHMTPQEVGGLQALAMAHGGSLTINPETGLPEANFLKKMLPMIAGFALAPLTAGTSLAFLGTPLGAAALVGGGTALATGNLGKGLMAGLGAYGGAGLGAGLAKVGAANAASVAAPAQSFGMSTAPGSANVFGGSQLGTALNNAKTAGLVESSNVAANLAQTAQAPVTMSNVSAGVKTLGQPGSFSNLYKALPGGTLPTLGIAALSGMSDQKGITPQQSKSYIRPYTYERTQRPGVYDMGAPMYADTPGSSAEQLYFNDSYTAQKPILAPGPEYAADGGLVSFAVGGPVEQMAALNAVGANTGYPQAGINTPMYANPMMQRPEAVNVISPSGDAGVTAYSGEPRFAFGGKATAVAHAPEGYKSEGSYQYSYDPKTMQFTQTGTPTLRPDMSSGKGVFGLLGNAIGGFQPPTLNTGAKVSGGIAPPAMGPAPAQPAMAAQPAYVPPAIPEYQSPEDQLGLNAFYGMMNQNLGNMAQAQGFAAGGGISHLGDYSDGGRLLKGPGDGVSDSIPAVIGKRQPARLADGEFVIPARIVSELGNGSTEAGARKLYAMMDRVQNARRKSIGKKKVAVDSKTDKLLPA
jgi:hypothetical protein